MASTDVLCYPRADDISRQFTGRGEGARHAMQSNNSVFMSLVLIVLLGVVFAIGIRSLSSGMVSTAQPAPTATAQSVVVVGPTTSTPTVQTDAQGHIVVPRPTPTATAPRPTATATSTIRVVMTTNHVPDAPPSDVTTVFSSAVVRVWCVGEFPRLLPTDAVSFKWMSRTTSSLIFNYNMTPITSPETKTYKAAYLDGPLSSGKYSCDIWLNGKLAGSAPFTVQ